MPGNGFVGFARALAERARARLNRARRNDGGFILLESIIAIALITVIMSAVGAEYVSSLSASNGMRVQAVGIQVANSRMDQIRSLHPSDLVTGRTQCAVDAERIDIVKFTTVGAGSLEAYDSSTTNGTPTNCPATGTTYSTAPSTTTIGSVLYTVYSYFECTTTPSNGSCVTTPSQSTISSNNIRAVVLVTWPGQRCPSVTSTTGNTSGPTCSYATSTVINDDPDLTFDLNQPLPSAPVVATIASSCPSSQQDCATVAVGDTVAYSMTVSGTTGVLPLTWAVTSGSLPGGLTMDTLGDVTGTVSGSATTVTSTITVTDAYLRTASDTITWTVENPLAFASSAQTGTSGTTLSKSFASSASGGGGSSYYTFSDPNSTLPAGLSISSAGVVSGKPTTIKTYSVTLTVTDSQPCPVCASPTTPRTATATFNWTISAGPLVVGKPNAQAWTVSTPLNSSTQVQLSATGGDSNYSWSATGLPSGITINSSTGLITGAPPATTATGTATVTVSDPTSAGTSPASTTFAWTLYAQPSLTNPGNQTNSVGGTVSVNMKPTCPNGLCSYAITGAPTNLAISSSGVITGTVGGSPNTYGSVVVKMTDAAGATASTTFSWTVLAAPTIGGLGARAYTETGTESLGVSYTCPTASCKITLANSIPGLGLSSTANPTGDKSASTSLTVTATSGTVYVGGTVQGSAVTGSATSANYSPVVTIATTADGAGANSAAVTWTAYTAPTLTTPGSLTSSSYASVNLAIASTCPNASCSYALTSAPTGLSISSSGVISGTITSAAKIYSSVGVSITDANSVTTSVTFAWTVAATTNNLVSLFNNVGVTADNNTNAGNLDGANGTTGPGNSLSATALQAATPNALTAGAEVNVSGLNFTWPATAGTGQPDNVVANGQSVSITGNGTTLGFLLTSSYAQTSGSGTITYGDGTTQTYTLTAPNWLTTGSGTSAATSTYYNKPNNAKTTQSATVYYVGVTLTYPGKTVATVTLPAISAAPNKTTAAMHIFAMSLTSANLATTFNNVGVTRDNNSTTRGYGNFDGSTDSYSVTALSSAGATAGSTLTTQGIGFTWPSTATGASATSYDNTLAAGQDISYSATGTTLGFLLSSSIASTTGTGTITYTDGTQQTFSVTAPLWSTNSSGTTAISTSYYNRSSGRTSQPRYVFYAGITLATGKTIDDIQLPNITNSPGNPSGAMHIFALGTK